MGPRPITRHFLFPHDAIQCQFFPCMFCLVVCVVATNDGHTAAMLAFPVALAEASICFLLAFIGIVLIVLNQIQALLQLRQFVLVLSTELMRSRICAVSRSRGSADDALGREHSTGP